ncbi:MAG TPA: hypothetical protein VE871_09895 [Longimicrobium sp.]|nr:hypothetical protein [Longimicrobium sp.]
MPTYQGVLLDEGGWAINVRTLAGVTSTAIPASVLAGLSSDHTYLIPKGTYTVNASTTVPPRVSLQFARGAVLKPAPGTTLTLSESPEAGPYQIFDTTAVSGVEARVKLRDDARSDEVHIEWWGADASGYWDKALRDAMRALVTNVVGNTGGVRFGRGIYRFAGDEPFSQLTTLDSLPVRRGFVFRGAGPVDTLLYLECGGQERWFYNSTDKHGMWSFYDLGFSSDNQAYGCGFRHVSDPTPGPGPERTGEEKEFHYHNCFFGSSAHPSFGIGGSAGMNKGWSYEGTTNADLNKWFGCRFGGFGGGLLHYDNDQSVAHALYGCDAELTGTLATTYSNAGGDLKVYGGSIILAGRANGAYYLVDHQASAKLWPGNNTIVFNGVRFEFKDTSSMVIKRQGASGYGSSNTVFRDCDIYAEGTVRTGVEVVQNALVAFERTNIPGTFLFKAIPPQDYITSAGTGGIILFDTCDVPLELHGLASVGALSGGRVIAEGCYHHVRHEVEVQRTGVDFDVGWENMGRHDRAVTRKLVVLKQKVAAWPHSGTEAEHTVVLPPSSIITGVRLHKPAGSGSATYQLHVGNDDQSVTYSSSTVPGGITPTFNLAHTILRNDLAVEAGTSLNTRTVRLWMTGASTVAEVNTGYALVEYI